jgi:hypothetical protein
MKRVYAGAYLSEVRWSPRLADRPIMTVIAQPITEGASVRALHRHDQHLGTAAMGLEDVVHLQNVPAVLDLAVDRPLAPELTGRKARPFRPDLHDLDRYVPPGDHVVGKVDITQTPGTQVFLNEEAIELRVGFPLVSGASWLGLDGQEDVGRIDTS